MLRAWTWAKTKASGTGKRVELNKDYHHSKVWLSKQFLKTSIVQISVQTRCLSAQILITLKCKQTVHQFIWSSKSMCTFLRATLLLYWSTFSSWSGLWNNDRLSYTLVKQWCNTSAWPRVTFWNSETYSVKQWEMLHTKQWHDTAAWQWKLYIPK